MAIGRYRAGAAAMGNEAQELTHEDVLRAGRTLFGAAFTAEAGGWRDHLKDTYRRRVMETHPDRARALGRGEVELAREFRAVADAYRILSSFRAGPLPHSTAGTSPAAPPRASRRQPRRTRPSHAPAPPRASPSAGPRVRASVRREELPRRRLRFAEFLYYSGRVRWSELVDAIAWQRAQRPAIGRIAVEFGFLAPDDVGVILERRREAGANAIPFGEWAVRLGYLTSFQLLAALGQQLRLQRPIGQFFVARGILLAEEIDTVRLGVLRHNTRF